MIHSRLSCSRFSSSVFPRRPLPAGGYRTRLWRRMGKRGSATCIICPLVLSSRGSPPIGRPRFCNLPRSSCSAVSCTSAAHRILAIPRGPRTSASGVKKPLSMDLPSFAVPGVCTAVCPLACAGCCCRRPSLQRGTHAGGPAADLDRGLSGFGQVLVVNLANLAGGISGDRSLCRAQHLFASTGLRGV